MKERLLSLTSYFALPYLFGKAAMDAKFRASLPERRGLGGWETIQPEPGRTVWLHGASLEKLAEFSRYSKNCKLSAPIFSIW